MPENIKSKAQAGLFGMVAAGKKRLPGLSMDEAKESMMGVKKKKLPKYMGGGSRGTPNMNRPVMKMPDL